MTTRNLIASVLLAGTLIAAPTLCWPLAPTAAVAAGRRRSAARRSRPRLARAIGCMLRRLRRRPASSSNCVRRFVLRIELRTRPELNRGSETARAPASNLADGRRANAGRSYGAASPRARFIDEIGQSSRS